MAVAHRCLLQLTWGFKCALYYDVIKMELPDILLGRPWLCDREVVQVVKANTHIITVDGKLHKLSPRDPHTVRASRLHQECSHRASSSTFSEEKQPKDRPKDTSVASLRASNAHAIWTSIKASMKGDTSCCRECSHRISTTTLSEGNSRTTKERLKDTSKAISRVNNVQWKQTTHPRGTNPNHQTSLIDQDFHQIWLISVRFPVLVVFWFNFVVHRYKQ